MNNRIYIYTHRKHCARHMLLNYLQLFTASREEKARRRTARKDREILARKKENKYGAKERDFARTAEERSCTKFPVYGDASSGTEAGRSIGRRIDPGPRVIVTSRVDRAAARHDRPRDKRPRKNTETHERGPGNRAKETVKERQYKTMGRSGIKRNVRNK